MKRFTALLLALALLAAAALCAVAGRVNALSDRVTVTEHTLSGDRSAADGLTLKMRTAYRNRLYWDTAFTVGRDKKPETVYTYFGKAQREPWSAGYDFFLYDAVTVDVYRTYEEGDVLTGLDLAIAELQQATPNGQSASRTFYLKDYFSCYPIGIDVNDMGINAKLTDGPLQRAFGDYFRIPVNDDDAVTVNVDKTYGSNLFPAVDSGAYGDYFSFLSRDVIAESRRICFLTFQNYFYNGEDEKTYVDTGLIPGGWGIYAFPFDPDVSFDSEHKGEGFLTGDIRTVLPLEKETEVFELLLNSDESRLLVFTEEKDGAYLTVLDTDTLLQTQRLRVGSSGFFQIKTKEGFTVAATNDAFSVLTEENGVFTLQYTVNEPIVPENAKETVWSFYDVDYKDGKLAWTSPSQGYDRESCCDFYVAVFDKTGLLYAGIFENGVGSVNSADSQYNCYTDSDRSPEVRWS